MTLGYILGLASLICLCLTASVALTVMAATLRNIDHTTAAIADMLEGDRKRALRIRRLRKLTNSANGYRGVENALAVYQAHRPGHHDYDPK